MENGSTVSSQRSRFSSYERLVAIGLAIVAVASPLFIDRNPAAEEEEEDEASLFDFSAWLPLLLLMLIFAIALLPFMDKSFATFDHYWIHRVGGSPGGILFILVVLALILKLKG
ncbi:uncharacterized protein LOC104436350 [Eucalyptus grandis]|uniref:Uncharacterized protein n=2 Tax=Eucalyptus grandis TaxID=71139 RepID=A0ACC3LBC8_EUCGR|nr:uncharacterized protein LOC104436350 [Eucalyptus grandis]KAK3436071.1 hypothetical protein EUGRSUZ_C00729 [Eucalyptus grandis]